YEPQGTCNANHQCDYLSSTIACTAGCANGRCSDDPCAGVTCSPPANRCQDLTTLIYYNAAGTWGAKGGCGNGRRTQLCQFGGRGGRCNQDPCAGVTCNVPPANTCVDGTTLKVYGTAGTCNMAGGCAYAWSTRVCQFGCSGGRCNQDPCAGVTCNVPP